jgi:broad specificity phosphatase PhoE
VQTAEVVASLSGMRPDLMPALREIYLGQWEGLRTDELAGRFPEAWASWTLQPDWDLVPGGEGAAAFEARSWSAVETLLARYPEGGDVLAVTHGGVIQMALYRILDRPSRGVFAFRIQNASITVIEKRDGRIVIDGVNDVGHLDPVLASKAGPA